MSLIGGGHNFITSMRRSLQDNFPGKKSWKSIKYSQSYDIVCHLALFGGKGLSIATYLQQNKNTQMTKKKYLHKLIF